jgi:hypothetical protein
LDPPVFSFQVLLVVLFLEFPFYFYLNLCFLIQGFQDFQNLNYVNGVFDGSKYTETKHELKYNLHFNFSKELLSNLKETHK